MNKILHAADLCDLGCSRGRCVWVRLVCMWVVSFFASLPIFLFDSVLYCHPISFQCHSTYMLIIMHIFPVFRKFKSLSFAHYLNTVLLWQCIYKWFVSVLAEASSPVLKKDKFMAFSHLFFFLFLLEKCDSALWQK